MSWAGFGHDGWKGDSGDNGYRQYGAGVFFHKFGFDCG
jgi:hypothetical protein